MNENYLLVRNRAILFAQRLEQFCSKLDRLSPQLEYLYHQAREISTYPTIPTAANIHKNVYLEFFDAVEAQFDALSDPKGRAAFYQSIRRTVGSDYWFRMMHSEPMSIFAHELDKYLRTHLPEKPGYHLKVLEIGAGVGSLTKLVSHRYSEYFVSDCEAALLRKVPNSFVYDFNRELNRSFDVIVASNALHCAHDKALTLTHLKNALNETGHLIFVEGTSHPYQQELFALNLVFGFFDGWWDQGGFMDKSLWLKEIGQAGLALENICSVQYEGMDYGTIIHLTK